MKLFSFTRFGGGGTDMYDVTADGNRFLVTETVGDEESSPVTLVVNWLGQIKEK